jgi:hypothetical protein
MTLLPIWTEQVKYLIGIFAILNPLGTIPIYLSLMADRRPDEMRRTSLKAAIAVAIILILRHWHSGVPHRGRAAGIDYCHCDVRRDNQYSPAHRCRASRGPGQE